MRENGKKGGHALANVDYLKRFPHLRGEARHNNEADLLADKARFNFYNSYHIELSQLLAKCQEGYITFMRHIHNIIYRMQSAIQHVKSTPAFRLQHPEQVMPRFITHVPPDHYPGSSFQPLELKGYTIAVDRFSCEVKTSHRWIVLSPYLLHFCAHD